MISVNTTTWATPTLLPRQIYRAFTGLQAFQGRTRDFPFELHISITGDLPRPGMMKRQAPSLQVSGRVLLWSGPSII